MKKLLLGVAFASSFLVGCAQQHDHAAAKSHDLCVMSGEKVDASAPKTTYDGHTVGFCCDKCAAKWNKLDDAGKKAALAKANTAAK